MFNSECGGHRFSLVIEYRIATIASRMSFRITKGEADEIAVVMLATIALNASTL